MDNVKKGSESTAKPKASESSHPTPSLQEKVARFEQVNQAYWKSQQDANKTNYEQASNAYRAFTNTLQEIKENVQQRYAEAYANYVNGQQEAMRDANPQLRAEKLHQDYMETVRRVYEDEQKLCAEAYQTYTNALQQAEKQKTAEYLSAYRNYLTDLKEAWLQLDVSAVVDMAATASMH